MTDVLIIFALILLNGLFATAELSIASAKKLRLEESARRGSEGARVALDLAARPSDFLSTIQIGITLISIFNGAFGQASLAAQLGRQLAGFAPLAPYADMLALAVVIGSITLASIVFGELVPKRIAMQYPEATAALLARPLQRLSWLMTPLVRLLAAVTELIIRLCGLGRQASDAPTTEEISGMLREGSDAGVLDRTEYDIARRGLSLRQQRVSALMTPRVDLETVDLQADIGSNLRTIAARPYSRFPVIDGDPAQVLGVIHAGDLFAQTIRAGTLDAVDLHGALRQPLQVPASANAMGLLELFRERRAELALVVDEHGQLLGMVTLTDLMGAVVGALPGIEAREADAVQRDDGSWLLDGAMELERLREVLGTQAPFPDEAAQGYQTLAGMLLHQLGHVPAPSEQIEWKGHRFEVVDMDRNRIDRVLVSPVEPAARYNTPVK
ncbi:hemolysin family protein [Massilia sp. CF038]|uniref:hemolysin family protein n=1 Tax=Massilia sp. CF038 TaxID=1881045 RepID=UPI0009211811|nr:hemolysin family protein [Massilia sp. CF038]SHH25582.1 putative hemolysin [Massilia sp. CF038]